jgi:hypothetical protein
MNTTPPVFNVERHNQIIDQIEKHPETWKQNDWHCGTTHCYGGWAQVFSGAKPKHLTGIQDARVWLGLTGYQADIAFFSRNTLEFLKSLPELFSYDQDGYDRTGINQYGRNIYGNALYDGFDRYGCYSNGYDQYGLDKYNNRKPLFGMKNG